MFCIDVSFFISIIPFFISFISFYLLLPNLEHRSAANPRRFYSASYVRLVTFPSLIPAKSTLRRLQRSALLSTLVSLYIKTAVDNLTVGLM